MKHGTQLRIIATAVSLLGAGCATEEWTQGLLAKRQAEVDERFLKTETEVREHDERIDRIEGRVTHLEVALTETRDEVRDVVTYSPAIVRARRTASGRRPAPPPPHRGRDLARTLVAVIQVPFGFDRANLDAGAKAALASVVQELREHPDMTIDLEGTTDSVGRPDYNVRLSERRVAAVKRWLTEQGVDQRRIVYTTGRGPVGVPAGKDPTKRRVMVKLMTPES
jgi:outer membrane protein OmpA-like peptidoglycan-associated protein